MKNKFLKIFLLTIFLILIFITRVEATPGNKDFVDDFFYQAIIDTLNEQEHNGINDRTLSYNVTEEELESLEDMPTIEDINLEGYKKINSINKNEERNIEERTYTKQENNTEKIEKEIKEEQNKEMISYFIMLCIAIMIIVYLLGKRTPRFDEDGEIEYDKDTRLYGSGYDDDDNYNDKIP